MTTIDEAGGLMYEVIGRHLRAHMPCGPYLVKLVKSDGDLWQLWRIVVCVNYHIVHHHQLVVCMCVCSIRSIQVSSVKGKYGFNRRAKVRRDSLVARSVLVA